MYKFHAIVVRFASPVRVAAKFAVGESHTIATEFGDVRFFYHNAMESGRTDTLLCGVEVDATPVAFDTMRESEIIEILWVPPGVGDGRLTTSATHL